MWNGSFEGRKSRKRVGWDGMGRDGIGREAGEWAEKGVLSVL